MTNIKGYIKNIIFCKICGRDFPKTNFHRQFCYECIQKGKPLGLEADKRYWKRIKLNDKH